MRRAAVGRQWRPARIWQVGVWCAGLEHAEQRPHGRDGRVRQQQPSHVAGYRRRKRRIRNGRPPPIGVLERLGKRAVRACRARRQRIPGADARGRPQRRHPDEQPQEKGYNGAAGRWRRCRKERQWHSRKRARPGRRGCKVGLHGRPTDELVGGQVGRRQRTTSGNHIGRHGRPRSVPPHKAAVPSAEMARSVAASDGRGRRSPARSRRDPSGVE